LLHYSSNQFTKWSGIINTTIEQESYNQQFLVFNFSESEKQIYLMREGSIITCICLCWIILNHKKQTHFIKTLQPKQCQLLQSKQQLNNLANNSKDSTVQTLLKNWQATNVLYTKAIQLTSEKRKLNNINLDSLQEQSQTLEKQLIAALPALESVITNTGFTGKEVATKLKSKEAIVHWVSFKYKSPAVWTDSVLYAAYIITPTDTAPKFVTVFEEKQLQQLLRNYYSGNGRSTIKKDSSISSDYIALYNLIWKPLLPYLKGATTVYNLPSGLLHKISFAALTDSSNQQLIDHYDIHQLLSINELVNPLKISTPAKTIALFGGANYDAATNTSQTNTVATPPMYRNANNNSTVHFNYLQGTKTEVETVAANAKTTTWKVQTYTNTNATEDNFKLLSGENAPKILHIATHGFYFPPTKTKPNNFITEDKNAPKDFPLLRSGLVLSGANNFWGKDTLLENKEDGIVTAQEISTMNLLNTDLVVLSACQTALGDINGSEGVYGLQRAFKMAGVKKLLMSLWEVPDAETAELMQLFYTNVFKGETYYNSFKKAQLAMKAKYKDPTKWAGFVLVGE
jgi:CHAT domain-containing protein